MDLRSIQSQGRARRNLQGGVRKGELTVFAAGERTGKSRVTHAHVAELIELGLLSKAQVARQFAIEIEHVESLFKSDLGIKAQYYKLSDADTNWLTLNEIAW